MEYSAHPTAIIDCGATIGEDTQIWHYAHLRGDVKIGSNCSIGQSAYIDQGVTIGDGCKIQNGALLYSDLEIGEDVFIGPNVVICNDTHPRADLFRRDTEPTIIKKGASIGACSVVLRGVSLGEYCVVGAGSVVTHDVPGYTLALGVPARMGGIVCTCGRTIVEDRFPELGGRFRDAVCPVCEISVRVDLGGKK